MYASFIQSTIFITPLCMVSPRQSPELSMRPLTMCTPPQLLIDRSNAASVGVQSLAASSATGSPLNTSAGSSIASPISDSNSMLIIQQHILLRLSSQQINPCDGLVRLQQITPLPSLFCSFYLFPATNLLSSCLKHHGFGLVSS